MMSGIAVSAVIYLVRMEGGLQRAGNMGDISKESVPLLVREQGHIAEMALVSDNNTAGMALLLKKVQLTGGKLADLDAELIQLLIFHAICAIGIFDFHS